MNLHGNPALSVPHLIAGAIGLAAGAVALYALKGEALHRRTGTIFSYAMLLVSLSGIAMALRASQKLNLIGGLLTFYMVSTALVTVRRRVQSLRWFDIAGVVLGVAIGVRSVALGFEAMNSASGRIDGLPPAPAFMFGAIALLAATGDVRMIVRRLDARARLARHLWRMFFAFFSAASSFFPAQLPKIVPAVRNSGLLWIPPVVVLLLMFYWLWRIRRDHALPPVLAVSGPRLPVPDRL